MKTQAARAAAVCVLAANNEIISLPSFTLFVFCFFFRNQLLPLYIGAIGNLRSGRESG